MPEQERISDSQLGTLASKIWFGSIEKDDFFQAYSKLIISSSVPSTPYMGFDMNNRARNVLDKTKAGGVEAKTAETFSPGAYKDGQLQILSNNKMKKSV